MSPKVQTLRRCKQRTDICTGRQTISFYAAPYSADNGNLRKFGATYRNATMFAPKQSSYQKEAMR